MKIIPVQTENPSFRARITSTHEFDSYFNAICTQKRLPFTECFNGLRRLRAIENHPSNAEIKFYTTHKDGSPWSIYGVIESQYAKYIDPEPVSATNSLNAISNILKRIFEKENSDKLGKLLGEKDISSLDKWMENFFRIHPLMKIRKPANTTNEMESSYSNWFSMQDGSLK